jgi:ornithine cyclodeaminase
MTDSVPFLDAETVRRLTPMPALIDALRGAFDAGGYRAPPRLAAEIGASSSLLVMPAWNAAARIGVKIVTIDRDARPSIRSTYLLSDGVSDRPLALIDGTMLTRRRTAAASVLAASYLARPEARSLLLLGTGALIAPLVEAYAGAFPLDTIRIWGRDPAKAEQAAAEARTAGHQVEAAHDLGAALAAADIVSSATLATAPLIAGAALLPGMHVDLIGAFRPEMCEADGAAFACSRVFVDTYEGALDEAGDLLQAIAGGHITADAIEGDLAALCGGRHPGRGEDAQAITLFKSVGTAIEDLAAAELLFDRWRAK